MEIARFENDIPLTLATAAHNGTSFVPERRGEQERASYASTLAQDFEMLAKYATTDERRAILADEFARYRQGYRRRFVVYLGARSRCLSTMITGGSNFPTARNAKRNRSADTKLDDLIGYREVALHAIKRKLRPELAPVMSGDADAPDRLAAKIAKRKRLQERMKAANAAIRKHAKAGRDAQILALVDLDFTPEIAAKLLEKDFAGRIGFPSYQLTNNNSEIRRLEGRLKAITEAQATPVTEIEGENARLVEDPPENRVRLYFPGKPDVQTRDKLKAHGFRWAPSLGCWQAYRNNRALDFARRFAGVHAPAITATTCGCAIDAPEADPTRHSCPCGDHCTDPACASVEMPRG